MEKNLSFRTYNIVYKTKSPEAIYICTNDLKTFNLFQKIKTDRGIKILEIKSPTPLPPSFLHNSYLLYYNKNYMRRKYKDFDLDDALKLTY